MDDGSATGGDCGPTDARRHRGPRRVGARDRHPDVGLRRHHQRLRAAHRPPVPGRDRDGYVRPRPCGRPWQHSGSGPTTWRRSSSPTSTSTTRAASVTSPRMFPNAEVVVHEAGARHLAEPDRLLASARRVFGSVLDDVFGLLAPDRRRTGSGRWARPASSTSAAAGGSRRSMPPGTRRITWDSWTARPATSTSATPPGSTSPRPRTCGRRPRRRTSTSSWPCASIDRFREAQPDPPALQPLRPGQRRRDDPGPLRGGATAVGRARPRRPARRPRPRPCPRPRPRARRRSATPRFLADPGTGRALRAPQRRPVQRRRHPALARHASTRDAG